MNPDDVPTRGLRSRTGGLLLLLAGFTTAPWVSGQVSAEFDGLPLGGNAPLTVQFQDLSGGTPTRWDWAFGDGGTSSAQSPSYTYSSPGTYTVTLTSSDDGGQATETKPSYVVVLPEPPTAAFSATDTVGHAPLTVSFTGGSTGTITSGFWDFGDGNLSTSIHPTHTYTSPGRYDVTLSVTGPGGTDVETQTALVHVRSNPQSSTQDPTTTVQPKEEADFFAFPRSGPAPLTVQFTNLSRGPWRRRSWNFGDGNNSTNDHPVHVYSTPGTYTVSLLVRRDFGAFSSVEVKPAYIVVTPPAGLLTGGGFETPGTQPQVPWGLASGTHHRIRSAAQDGAEGHMPTQGDRWLELSSTKTTGVAEIAYPLVFDALHPKIAFDAAFLYGGARGADDPFLSVDLEHGTTSHNVYYRDRDSEFPFVSALHGLPMTAVTTLRLDLGELFPGASSGDRIELRARLGKGGADESASFGYLDALRRLPTATAVPRPGSGINASCFAASPPRLGEPWTARVRTESLPSTRFVAILGSDRRTRLSLAGGELFTALGDDLRFLHVIPSAGPSIEFHGRLPADPVLAGHVLHTQALLLGSDHSLFCNGLDLLLGY